MDKFIGLAKKYTRITELTPEILHTFVSKIVIHERRERFKQNTEQQIDMYPYGNPVKSWLPLQTKEARDGARGPGDLGLRRPERRHRIISLSANPVNTRRKHPTYQVSTACLQRISNFPTSLLT